MYIYGCLDTFVCAGHVHGGHIGVVMSRAGDEPFAHLLPLLLQGLRRRALHVAYRAARAIRTAHAPARARRRHLEHRRLVVRRHGLSPVSTTRGHILDRSPRDGMRHGQHDGRALRRVGCDDGGDVKHTVAPRREQLQCEVVGCAQRARGDVREAESGYAAAHAIV